MTSSAIEIHELWEKFLKEGDIPSKEALILEYIPLVQKLSNQMAGHFPAHIAKDDLYGYGIFGLLESIDRYNPSLGVPFSFFAGKRIKGAMIDGLRKEDWIPTALRKRAKQIENAFRDVEMASGGAAEDSQVAEALDMSEDELQSWLSKMQFLHLLSLDEPLPGDEELYVKDNLKDPKSPDPIDKIQDDEIKSLLADAIENLPEKERLIVSLFYYEDLSNKEIAQVMELSESRISQLHSKAVFRLRNKLNRYYSG
ncbi:MAG: FliA/WhiG family RNA polymerase sigma factor [Peptococcaceae bacterium]|jgi:RNA polymerase sigma factor for flagellar operon FliA|nr:FliA/WhiG family RNA polymerase sigma factor [Peptococcaceae bacterium]